MYVAYIYCAHLRHACCGITNFLRYVPQIVVSALYKCCMYMHPHGFIGIVALCHPSDNCMRAGGHTCPGRRRYRCIYE